MKVAPDRQFEVYNGFDFVLGMEKQPKAVLFCLRYSKKGAVWMMIVVYTVNTSKTCFFIAFILFGHLSWGCRLLQIALSKVVGSKLESTLGKYFVLTRAINMQFRKDSGCFWLTMCLKFQPAAQLCSLLAAFTCNLWPSKVQRSSGNASFFLFHNGCLLLKAKSQT